jgi:hypothetical protein
MEASSLPVMVGVEHGPASMATISFSRSTLPVSRLASK